MPGVHWDAVRRLEGKKYYVAEVTDGAVTHRIYLEKKKVEEGEVEVRELPARAAQVHQVKERKKSARRR